MAIEIVECTTASQRDAFIAFQWEIYTGDRYWVPPLMSDRRRIYDKAKNEFFQHSDAALFLAKRDGKIVGTIAAIHNTRHNAKWQDKTGFFGAFECIDDPAVAAALFDAAKAWLKARGLDTLRGPATLSLNDECGLLIDGFDGEPQPMMTYNPPYYRKLVEGYGFAKSMDLFAWWIAVEDGDAAVKRRVGRIADMAQRRGKFTFRHIDIKRVNAEYEHARNVLYAGPWEKNWGHVTPTEPEMRHTLHGLAQIADPELTFFAEIDGKCVGVGACLPNVNRPLRAAYPHPKTPEWWTVLKFLWYRRTMVNSVRFLVLGVSEEHRMSGIDAAIAVKMNEALKRKGFTGAECSWILESNDVMNRIIEAGGGKIYRTYRLYDLKI
jgi:hypothetical protein